MRVCIECKKNVVSHYRAYFCEDCIKNFFEGGKNVKSELKGERMIGQRR